MQPKFNQNKKIIEFLTLYPAYDGLVKKTISRYCPLRSLTRTSMFTFDFAATSYNVKKSQ